MDARSLLHRQQHPIIILKLQSEHALVQPSWPPIQLAPCLCAPRSTCPWVFNMSVAVGLPLVTIDHCREREVGVVVLLPSHNQLLPGLCTLRGGQLLQRTQSLHSGLMKTSSGSSSRSLLNSFNWSLLLEKSHPVARLNFSAFTLNPCFLKSFTFWVILPIPA